MYTIFEIIFGISSVLSLIFLMSIGMGCLIQDFIEEGKHGKADKK